MQAANIKSEADSLISQHESLIVDVERQKSETESLLVRGYEQQQRTDELLADADAARDTARKAVAKAEDTLREANETLRTLRGTAATPLRRICPCNKRRDARNGTPLIRLYSGVASMEQMEQLLPRTARITFVIRADPMRFLGEWGWG